MEKKRRDPLGSSVPVLNLTPMIDVVFQLIIFFMCAMKFKTLDMKLDANLPKTHGIDQRIVEVPEKVPVKILVRHEEGQGVPRLSVVTEEIRPDLGPGVAPLPPAPGPAAPRAAHAAHQALHEAHWERYVAPKLAELERRIRTYHAREPDLVYHVDASPRVRHAVVVGVLDTLVAAGIENVEIRGIRAPGPGR